MAYKIGVVGCGGRMGQMLVREIVGTKDCAFAGGTESPGSANLGRDAGEVAGIGAIQAKIGSDARALVHHAATRSSISPRRRRACSTRPWRRSWARCW